MKLQTRKRNIAEKYRQLLVYNNWIHKGMHLSFALVSVVLRFVLEWRKKRRKRLWEKYRKVEILLIVKVECRIDIDNFYLLRSEKRERNMEIWVHFREKLEERKKMSRNKLLWITICTLVCWFVRSGSGLQGVPTWMWVQLLFCCCCVSIVRENFNA